MKKLFFITALTTITLLTSCSKDNIEDSTSKDSNDFISVNLPEGIKYQTLKNGSAQSELEIVEITVVLEDSSEITGLCRIEMPDNSEEKLISFEMTRNIFEATNLDPDFWLNMQPMAKLKGIKASCIAECQKEFTDDNGEKIKGRGACKAGCWAETAAKVLTAAAAVAVVLS